MEVWKDVVGYEGLYQVSNQGRVCSCERLVRHSKGGDKAVNQRMLKPQQSHHGYQVVALSNLGKVKRFFVHRLVADAFIENPNGYTTVNHIDGNKNNPCASNLEWCSPSQNAQHAKKCLGIDFRTNGKRNKKVVRSDGKEFISINEAAKESGVSRGCIYLQMQGKRNHTGGYQFHFAAD